MAAVGRAGVPIEPESIDICFDDVYIVKDGMGCGPEAETQATSVLRGERFTITIKLQMGEGGATVHTCDLSTGYVRINADYRS